MQINIFTLGCKVNQYESGALGRALERRGFSVCYGLEPPGDLYILNTCAVTAEAERKSRQAVGRISAAAPDAGIVVCGCASENDAAAFRDKTGVAVVFGDVKDKEALADRIAAIGDSGQWSVVSGQVKNDSKGQVKGTGTRERGTGIGYHLERSEAVQPNKDKTDNCELSIVNGELDKDAYGEDKTRAYIKAQDGCDSFCSYCLIPHVKGRSRSRPIAEIAEEAKALARRFKELVLIGINLSDYRCATHGAQGAEKDKSPNTDLTGLILALKDIDARIRLGSLEPRVITPAFLDALKGLKAFCPHFHLSLQSGSDRILKLMNRRYTAAEYLEKARLIRSHFPYAGLTTDIICGFPGETEEDFRATCETARAAGFSAIHIFPYSERAGTAAARLKEARVPKTRAAERVRILSEIRDQMRTTFLKDLTSGAGSDIIVLIEQTAGGVSSGYSENYVKCYCREPLTVRESYRMRAVGLYRDGLESQRMHKEQAKNEKQE
ncbi:tRNA (N(6)-L-threonylcarbamoyladenosine(37)-C(2))- methylthiotransferase MtaB [Clostridia bacterium]|nr:tRNA (N(6)-L-threonylcarbamoyladenosine(37)-C(2))- methylthiotransferase MtaB [Clostridia bacterium]